MKRLLPHPVMTPILTMIWLLLVNSITLGHVVLGILLGWAIPLFTLRFWPDKVTIFKPFQLVKFTVLVIYDILIANLIVARLILSNPRKLKPTFIIVPLALKSDIAISLLTNVISLTPGTVSSLLSEDCSQLIVHVLNTDNADDLIATIKTRYETPLKEIFENA